MSDEAPVADAGIEQDVAAAKETLSKESVGQSSNDDAQVSEGTAEPQAPPTEQEIAEAEKILTEYEELKKTRSATPPVSPIDYEKFGSTLVEAIKPLTPKPPDPPKVWEDDRALLESGPKGFRDTMGAWFKHQQDAIVKEYIEPLKQENQTLKGMLHEVLNAMQENPQYGQISQLAEKFQKYGIDRATALKMARDQIGELSGGQGQQTPIKGKPGVPRHMSTPDTRGTEVEETSKGPADFKSIIRDLRATGKY